MSRSGYVDDFYDGWATIRWRGAVKSALRGKRGQAFLRELADSMDAMKEKRLITNNFKADGEFCTLGVIANRRGVDLQDLLNEDYYGPVVDHERLADRLGVAAAMAQEIMFMNDEAMLFDETPEVRWRRMRDWVSRQISQQETNNEPE